MSAGVAPGGIPIGGTPMGGNPGKPSPLGIGPTFCEAPGAELDAVAELLEGAAEADGFGIGIQREPPPPDSASRFIISYMCMFNITRHNCITYIYTKDSCLINDKFQSTC